MRDGECWEQQTLEQTIRGTESGLSEKLPTPCAGDHKSKPTSASWKAKGAINYSLANPEIQAKWPTPTAHMAKETNAPSEHKRNTPTLTAQVNWPTPRASDFKGATSAEAMSKAKTRGFNPNLPEATAASVGGGKLNPTWVEWLMGWPLEWTDLKPLEMDKSHCVPQQLGES
jgi:DNA (cytosine-5)-methyltransferase 1